MSVTVIVNGNRTVVHKGSGGKAPATPDFCKTPAPPGPPVPVPYVILAQSSNATDVSTTVKMDGKPIMLKNSKFSRCSGDEAGTLKGVASNTNKGVAKFANYSFDVKVEGKNVPRLGDPMTNNGNAPNTMTPAEAQAAAAGLGMTVTEFRLICGAFCEAQREYNRENISGRGCISKEFERRIGNHIDKGRLPSGTLLECTFLIPKRGPAQLVTGAVFLANKVAGAVQPWAQAAVSAVSASTGPVNTMVGNALSGMLKGSGSASRICRPDIVLPHRRCYDVKAEWKGGKDKWKDGQRTDQRRVDAEGKPKQLNKNSCKC